MITVDSREPRIIYENLNKLLPDTQWSTLDAGDYKLETLSGLSLISRKTVEDLINSVSSGHLTEECRKIAEVTDKAILLIEGFITITIDGSLRTKNRVWRQNWNWLWNYLIGLQLHGFLIDFSPNQFFTVNRLISLHEYFNKDEHRSLRAITMPVGYTNQIKVLSCFPGYNVNLSERMIKKFETLRAIFNAPWQSRVEIDGVGQIKSQTIDRILDERYEPNSTLQSQ